MTKLFELNNNLFKEENEDCYVGVSDEEIKDNECCLTYNCGDYYIVKFRGYDNKSDYKFHICDSKGFKFYTKWCKKIIFSTKFIHESIPVLDIGSEEYKFASENREFMKSTGYTTEAQILEFRGIIKGYQKAKEKYKFTEEDLPIIIKFIKENRFRITDKVCDKYEDDGLPYDKLSYEVDSKLLKELIQHIQQPKEIKSIEVEYEKKWTTEIDLDLTDSTFDYYPIILPNGKIKCKVNY